METGEDEVLVVDCRGNMQTGCLGGMLMTALATNGAAGLVVDGCVRDLPEAIGLADELPVFVRGGTPHNAGHYEMYPWSFQEPVGLFLVARLGQEAKSYLGVPPASANDRILSSMWTGFA